MFGHVGFEQGFVGPLGVDVSQDSQQDVGANGDVGEGGAFVVAVGLVEQASTAEALESHEGFEIGLVQHDCSLFMNGARSLSTG